MREIWVRIQDLPDRAQLVQLHNNNRPRWDDHAYLLADIVHVLSGRPHPARPKVAKPKPQQTSRREALRRRRIAQKRQREALSGKVGDGD